MRKELASPCWTSNRIRGAWNGSDKAKTAGSGNEWTYEEIANVIPHAGCNDH